MKSSLQKILFSASLVMFLYLAFTLNVNAAIQKGSEILVVEVIFGFDGGQDVSGVYLSYPNGKTESIALVGYVGKDNIEKNGVIITKKFNELYSEGWRLENSCGGDNSKRYLFIK